MRQTFFAENTLPAVLQVIAETITFLAKEGLNDRSLFIGELVLEEMLTNTVKYAYDDDRVHRMEVVAEVGEGKVKLELRDDGHFFDPLQAAAPDMSTPVLEQKVGGRGIHLVKKFVDEIEYRREDGWNFLRVGFPVEAAAPGKS